MRGADRSHEYTYISMRTHLQQYTDTDIVRRIVYIYLRSRVVALVQHKKAHRMRTHLQQYEDTYVEQYIYTCDPGLWHWSSTRKRIVSAITWYFTTTFCTCAWGLQLMYEALSYYYPPSPGISLPFFPPLYGAFSLCMRP